jgi:hypothetical protein
MMVGDSWVTKGYSHKHVSDIFHTKVTEVEEDGSFVTEVNAEKGGTYYLFYNNKYQVIKKMSSTGKLRKTPEPRPLPLSFPLFVGKKWSDKYYGTSVGGLKYEYRNEYSVIKYEIVNTKAGSFKAFKIRRWNHNVDTGGQWCTAMWYSPELKCVIKSSHPYYTNTELLSYQLAKKG